MHYHHQIASFKTSFYHVSGPEYLILKDYYMGLSLLAFDCPIYVEGNRFLCLYLCFLDLCDFGDSASTSTSISIALWLKGKRKPLYHYKTQI